MDPQYKIIGLFFGALFGALVLVILYGFLVHVIVGIKNKALKNCPYEHYIIYQVGLLHYAIKLRCKVLFFWTWLWLRDTKTQEIFIIKGDDTREVIRTIMAMMDSRHEDFISNDQDGYRYRKPIHIYAR